jgi:hypothetical protein
MTLANKVTQFIQDADVAHAIVHGDENTVVQTEGGPVRTFAKLLADGLGFLTRLAKTDGSSQIGHGSGTVQSVLDALQLPDYAALRAYAGDRRMVNVTGYMATSAPVGIAGLFVRDDKDTLTADNGGTVIVAASGVRWKRRRGIEVNPEWFGAIGDGVVDDTASLQAACNEGGIVDLGLKIFKTMLPVALTKRQTRLHGTSLHNTYINLQMAVVDRGNWATGTAYAVNDLVRSADGLPYFCKVAHAAGTFAADWAAGKWELYTVISVRASDCECANFYSPVPAKAVGIAVQGTARFNAHHVNLAPRDTSSGVGIVMDDRDYLGTFRPGSYTHYIGPGNLIAATTQGVRQFEYGIFTAGTTGGINALKITGNHIVGDQGIWLNQGGGNFMNLNLLQSFTGTNSGGRPFTGGIGFGVYYNGSLSVSSNYFERFEADFKSSGSVDATLQINGHAPDGSNKFQDANATGVLPGFASSSYGVSALKFDDMVTSYGLSGNNQVIPTRMAGRFVHGGGATRTGITLDTTGATEGQVFVLKNTSWAFELLPGTTADLGQAGSSLLIGQQGTLVNGDQTACDLAVFMFNGSKWELFAAHWFGPGADTYRSYSVTANNAQVPITARTMMLTGAGAVRTGVTLANGAKYGQQLTLCGNSWGVQFAAAGVLWLNNAAPTLGSAAGQVALSHLVYTASGWYEEARNTRP